MSDQKRKSSRCLIGIPERFNRGKDPDETAKPQGKEKTIKALSEKGQITKRDVNYDSTLSSATMETKIQEDNIFKMWKENKPQTTILHKLNS